MGGQDGAVLLGSNLALETRHLALLGAAHHVLDRYLHRRFLALDPHRFDHDHLAQPLLERALHRQLHSGAEALAVRLEDQLQQAAAEGWAVDPFAGVVKRTCSIRSRICSSGVALAVRPRPSK